MVQRKAYRINAYRVKRSIELAAWPPLSLLYLRYIPSFRTPDYIFRLRRFYIIFIFLFCYLKYNVLFVELYSIVQCYNLTTDDTLRLLDFASCVW